MRPPPDLDAPHPAFARYRPLVDDWPAFCAALARPLPATAWPNTARLDPVGLARALAALGLAADVLPWTADPALREAGFPPALRLGAEARLGRAWLHAAGLLHVQEEASLVPAALLAPGPADRVLDLCAAPGGKTALLSRMMRGRGTLVANDHDIGRMRALRNTVERLGLVNVATTVHDGRRFPAEAGPFDRVLVDAPCSCEGTWRRSPRIGRRRERLVARQAALLRRGAELVRPGGRLVYSTCTFAPEENEAVVDGLLRAEPAWRVLPADLPGLRASPGLTRWEGADYRPDLANALRIWPEQNDSGGFFVALLARAGEGGAADEAGRGTTSAARRSAGPRAASDEVVEAPRQAEDRDARAPLAALGEARALLDARFGLPEEAWAGLRADRRNREGIHLAAEDHAAPERPRPDAVGILAIRTAGRFPKLTTAGAQLLGLHATANVVELDEGQRDAYLRREAVAPRAEQLRACAGRGYAILRFRGHPLGLGLQREDARAPAGLRVESEFPKAWALQGDT